MSTKTITLTNTPVQVTDGSNSGFVQGLGGGGFFWSDADASPDISLGGNHSTELTINPPFVVWIWGDDVAVNLTVR